MTDEREVDVSANRSASKWTRKEQLGRVLWGLASPLFFLSPRPLWSWRRQLLRMFGATVGRNVHIYPSVRVTIPWNLTLHDECAVGDRAQLSLKAAIFVQEAMIGSRQTCH